MKVQTSSDNVLLRLFDFVRELLSTGRFCSGGIIKFCVYFCVMRVHKTKKLFDCLLRQISRFFFMHSNKLTCLLKLFYYKQDRLLTASTKTRGTNIEISKLCATAYSKILTCVFEFDLTLSIRSRKMFGRHL